MKILPMIATIVLVIIDQIIKFFCIEYLMEIETITIIEGILNFTYVENRGMAFGMFQGARWFFVVFTVVLVIFMIYHYKTLGNATKIHRLMRLSLILVMAGAIGNWIDRMFLGYVVDFLHVQFIDFPVFNFADILVVCGTIFYSILTMFFEAHSTEELPIDELTVEQVETTNEE